MRKKNIDIIILGCLYAPPKNPKHNFESGRACVYDINGISSTIVSMAGGGNKPYIVVKQKNNENKDQTGN